MSTSRARRDDTPSPPRKATTRSKPEERLDGDVFDLLTVRQVARGLGVHVNTAWTLVRTKRIASLKVGGQVRVRRTDVDAYLDREAAASETS